MNISVIFNFIVLFVGICMLLTWMLWVCCQIYFRFGDDATARLVASPAAAATW